MRRFYLLLISLFFLNVTASLGRAIPYSGFYTNSGFMPVYSSMWSPVYVGDPCGISYRQLIYDEKFPAHAKSASEGNIIGSSTTTSYQNILVRTRTERWEKSTVYTPGASCPPPNTEMMIMNATTYNYPPVSYYGFKVTITGLTYYGWVVVSSGYYNAYIEDIPGFSIRVGDYIGNTTYPSSFVKLSGTVYRDNNIDGTYNTGDAAVSYQKVFLENTIYTTTTGLDGTYSLLVPGSSLSGSKNVKLELGGGDVYNTPANGSRAFTFPQYSSVTELNFGVNYNLTTTSSTFLSVNIYNDSRHRRCFKSSIRIEVYNRSNQSLTDIPVSIEIPAYVEILNSVPAYQSLQAKVATYNIPTLAAHSGYTISLTDSIICGIESIRGQSQCYRASIDMPFEGSDIFPYYECQNSMHMFKLVNKGNAEMTDSVNYKVFANNVWQGTYKYKTSAQDTFYIGIPNDGRSIRLEAFQESSNNRTNLRYSIAEGCGSGNVLPQNIGWADLLTDSENTYYSATSCFTIVDSYDPNELLVSPTGWGTEHKIVKEQLISYHIGFQNTGSADAVSIVLVDTLSSALDLSTFKVKYSTHAYRSTEIVPLPDGRLRLAVTYAGINLPPSSVNEPGSHGYVEFSILPKSTASIGTQIRNTAYIYFDFNSYIQTNSVLQTIALPETVSDPVALRTTGATFSTDNQSLTYGDAPIAPTLTTNAGADGLNATSLHPEIVTFESGKLVIHKSGTATVNYKHNGNTRYLPVAGEQVRTITVSKAPLNVQAVSVQRFVGEANPVLEWIATGFVYNEDESVLQGNPEINCSANASSAIADYPIDITAGTLSAENYDISYTAGTLKVVQATGTQNWSASGIRVFPIPSRSGRFTVDVPYEKLDRIVLTDMLGRSEVYEQGQINSQLEGIILIKIYTDKGIYSGKVELSH